jgi:hypothetical protein
MHIDICSFVISRYNPRANIEEAEEGMSLIHHRKTFVKSSGREVHLVGEAADLGNRKNCKTCSDALFSHLDEPICTSQIYRYL